MIIFQKFYFKNLQMYTFMFYFEPNSIEKFFWESDYQILVTLLFSWSKNSIFGHHFATKHFVGHQLCWKDHLVFHCHAVCMDGRMDLYGGRSSTKKVTVGGRQWPVYIKLGMLVALGTSASYVSLITKCTYYIAHFHTCSDWQIKN